MHPNSPAPRWHDDAVRYREFQTLAAEVLGKLAEVTLNEHTIRSLDGRTATQALADGYDPARVWHALADDLEIPEPQRWGKDAKRPAPPGRR